MIMWFKQLFCRHVWFSFKADTNRMSIHWDEGSYGLNMSLTPKVCMHCKKVEWIYVKGNVCL